MDEIWDVIESVSGGFLTYLCSIFSGAGKYCLAHGLRQLRRDVKMTSKILNFSSDVTYALP